MKKLRSNSIIEKTSKFVEKKLRGEGTGHDWFHIERVVALAKRIAKEEMNADLEIIELAALLHDIADWKFNGGDLQAGSKAARNWLQKLEVEETTIEHVCAIIDDISFKGAKVKTSMRSKEGMIVQDADRLDALGAIGIARTFAYGGSKGREIWNPDINPRMHESFAQYKKNTSPTVNHFYEKLFLLKDLMNTPTGKKVAQERHEYMEKFLERFYKEWEGKL